MKIIGLVLIGLGISVIGGGVFTMPYGFDRRSILLDGYRKAKSESREPTLDQKWAHSTTIMIKPGLFLVLLGVVIWFVGFLTGEE
jgi:hypothetical protein